MERINFMFLIIYIARPFQNHFKMPECFCIEAELTKETFHHHQGLNP